MFTANLLDLPPPPTPTKYVVYLTELTPGGKLKLASIPRTVTTDPQEAQESAFLYACGYAHHHNVSEIHDSTPDHQLGTLYRVSLPDGTTRTYGATTEENLAKGVTLMEAKNDSDPGPGRTTG